MKRMKCENLKEKDFLKYSVLTFPEVVTCFNST